jgi:hypothetical protein
LSKTRSKNRSGARRNQSQNLGRTPGRRQRPEPEFLRFQEVQGKTVEFVEMSTNADYPSIEIGFGDKTALRFVMQTVLSMEPTYSNWKTGDERVLRAWPAIECQ